MRTKYPNKTENTFFKNPKRFGIKSINYDQHGIIKDIIFLHCNKGIELDPTYSKGYFYKNSDIKKPIKKYDLYPTNKTITQANANKLPEENNSIYSIMFDPPFISGDRKISGIMRARFKTVGKNMKELLNWYNDCLLEFYRILQTGGTLIFKCQDVIEDHKQHMAHVSIINNAEKIGFKTKDLFVLLAKNRPIGGKWKNQEHARKFHSYFIVFKK